METLLDDRDSDHEEESQEREDSASLVQQNNSATASYRSSNQLLGQSGHSLWSWVTIRSSSRSWVAKEVIQLFKLALPITLMFIFQQLLLFISLVFVGHITGRSLELDAAALALSFANVSGLSVGIGLSTATETLCSQAYGFKNYKRVGIILQRGILILAITMFPVLVVWLNAETLLLLLRQKPCVASLTGRFMQIYCIAIPSIFLFELLQRYLQSQSIVWALTWVYVLTDIIAVVLHAALIYGVHMGVIGAAIALSLSFVSSPLLLIAYVWFRGLHKQTWGGWSWQSLHEWGQFLKLGIPGLIMMCAEWWSYEIATLVTGAIDETQLGINSVILSLLSVVFMVPFGIGVAAGVRVGNELGAGNPVSAKRASYSAIGMTLCWTMLVSITLISTRNVIGRIFTKDEEVIEGVAVMMYVACPFVFFDHLQGVLTGILRGYGQQVLGAVVNFISFYGIGLPIGISLALAAHMGTLGMWIGLGIGSTVSATTFVVVVLRTNWEYQSKRAMKNARDENKEEHSDEESTSQDSIDSEESQQELIPQAFARELQEKGTGDSPVHGPNIETTVEEIPLVSHEEEEPEQANIITRQQSVYRILQSRLKLLLYRSSFFAVGFVLLIAGGIASQYHPPADYFTCSDTNSTHSSTVVPISSTTLLGMPVPSPTRNT